MLIRSLRNEVPIKKVDICRVLGKKKIVLKEEDGFEAKMSLWFGHQTSVQVLSLKMEMWAKEIFIIFSPNDHLKTSKCVQNL